MFHQNLLSLLFKDVEHQLCLSLSACKVGSYQRASFTYVQSHKSVLFRHHNNTAVVLQGRQVHYSVLGHEVLNWVHLMFRGSLNMWITATEALKHHRELWSSAAYVFACACLFEQLLSVLVTTSVTFQCCFSGVISRMTQDHVVNSQRRNCCCFCTMLFY